jgi:hypothetical protein
MVDLHFDALVAMETLLLRSIAEGIPKKVMHAPVKSD